MEALHISHFTNPNLDEEQKKLAFLAELSKTKRRFRNNALYPDLRVLIDLHNSLKKLSEAMNSAEKGFPKELSGIDWSKKELIYSSSISDDGFKSLSALCEWAMEQSKTLIEEGIVIYEFLKENMQFTEVGVIPHYVNEGYFLVNNPESAKVIVLQYEMSVYTSSTASYRGMKTKLVEEFLEGPESDPRMIKIKLIEQKKELPNPATYACYARIDFPFEASVLPVAKRRLMEHLTNAA